MSRPSADSSSRVSEVKADIWSAYLYLKEGEQENDEGSTHHELSTVWDSVKVHYLPGNEDNTAVSPYKIQVEWDCRYHLCSGGHDEETTPDFCIESRAPQSFAKDLASRVLGRFSESHNSHVHQPVIIDWMDDEFRALARLELLSIPAKVARFEGWSLNQLTAKNQKQNDQFSSMTFILQEKLLV